MSTAGKKNLASERWKMLREAILAAKHEEGYREHSSSSPSHASPPSDSSSQDKTVHALGTNTASVRRFASFNLFTVMEVPVDEARKLIPNDSSKEGGRVSAIAHHSQEKWLKYYHSDSSTGIIVDPVVKIITKSTSLEAMMGFNNTGNVCIWPSEEILAFHCLEHSKGFRDLAVCELGCGMTGLGGLVLACTQQPSEILLTDGNCASVENVREILQANLGKFGRTNTSAEVLVWDKSFLQQVHPHDGKFDYVICADCLFFEEVHVELVQVILKLLKPDGGAAVIFAPRRNGTLGRFCRVARKHFLVEISDQYDALVSRRHEAALKQFGENDMYNPDLHFPLQLRLQLL